MGSLVKLEPAAAVKQEEETLTKRSTLVRKREEADLDGSLLTTPTSPSKKAKVTFSDNDHIKILTDDERPDSLREDVRLTLKKYEHGDTADYAKLLSVFEKEDDDVPSIPDRKQGLAMTGYTAALSAHVSLLKRSYERLVHAILGSCWAARDDRAAEVHVQFLRHLVSSRTQWTPDVLKSIISGFTNTVVDDDLLAEAGTPRTVYEQRLHLALLHINETVPSSMSHLAPLLRSEFPPPSCSQKQHGIYVHNLLTMVKYTPQLRSEILSIITERTVEVDAQVQADLEDLTEDVGDDVIEKIAGSQCTELAELNDEDDEDDDVDDDEYEGQELLKQKVKARNIARTIGKVDTLLESLFRYYNNIFTGPQIDTHTKALESLIAQFKASILPSSRSRHAQFLLFRFSQTSPAYVDIFLGVLLEIIIDERQQSTVRQAAAAYLGSYIARGEHVEAQTVRDTFDFVSVQLSQYRQRYESRCTGPDLQKYPVYYSLMQALIYIFCFRWRDLELRPDDSPSSSTAYFTATTSRTSPPTHTFVRGIKETFTSNIFSRFNPLKVCNPDIVGEFARMAHALDLIWVFGKIETNLRIRLGGAISSTERETALSSRKDESLWQLEAYFPFDPYTLPRSRKWVVGNYRLWNGEVEGERKYIGRNNLDSDEESDEDSEDDANGSDNDEDDNAF